MIRIEFRKHNKLAKKDDAKISLKSGPLEGRKVWSKDFGFGVIYWDDFYSCYKVRRKIGTDRDEDEVYERSFLSPQFELVGDDPVESKPDDRIDALEKRVAELEKNIKEVLNK